ncbi:DnaJ domain-containing protein [Cytophagales bacterium LB-30]|uniref:DnaJ domain-containing protein n=1 Tax=Shiella aurantiaca TaxID=3058365 RepID=A0ABT8F142_9BACT|nr:DnaJ domain-containing protein [Shiella aurantiaca]MDN4164155.1 DnaJ domain-containing protein [Shiella aurantiaca]
MHAKYYQCLGLTENANKAQVKRAYRQLALSLHPDRNPDPKAHARFIEVSEAYEILMGERKESFDFWKEEMNAPVVDEREEKRKRHRERLRKKAQKEAEAKAKRTRMYLLILSPIIAGLMIFYWAVCIDLFRPEVEMHESIVEVRGEYTQMNQHAILNNYLIFTASNSIFIDKYYPLPLMHGEVVYTTSPWFGIESLITYSCDCEENDKTSVSLPYKNWLRNASLLLALLTSIFMAIPFRKPLMDLKVKLSYIILFLTFFFLIIFSSL